MGHRKLKGNTNKVYHKKKQTEFHPSKKQGSKLLPDQPCKPVSCMKAGFSKSKYGIKIAAI
jgi:hypothetical protein